VTVFEQGEATEAIKVLSVATENSYTSQEAVTLPSTKQDKKGM